MVVIRELFEGEKVSFLGDLEDRESVKDNLDLGVGNHEERGQMSDRRGLGHFMRSQR